LSEETKKPSSRRDFLKLAGSFVAGAVVAGAGMAATQPAAVTQTVTMTQTAAGAGPTKLFPGGIFQNGMGAGQEKVWIPIVNKMMSFDDVVAEIEAEKTVTVANWTYWGLIDTFYGPALKYYIKQIYGVDVDVTWTGTQSAKGGFMGALETSLAAGQTAPFDLTHLEQNFFPYAVDRGLAAPFLPSPLVPWAQYVDSWFLHYPYGIQFQNHAFPCFTINTKYVGDWLNGYKALADPRLKGKLSLWPTSDNGLWGWWAVMAGELGYDYHNLDDVKKTLDWVAKNIHPNVLKYTDDEGELDQLLSSETTWVSAYWCALPEGYRVTNPVFTGSHLFPSFKGVDGKFPAPHPNLPGFLWIPKNTASPILAQIAADFELSPLALFPDIHQWKFGPDDQTSESLWARAEEGLLGPGHEQFVPGWVNALGPKGIGELYPTIEQAKAAPQLDWLYIQDNVDKWIEYWKSLTAT
jgi:hypothetical protein